MTADDLSDVDDDLDFCIDMENEEFDLKLLVDDEDVDNNNVNILNDFTMENTENNTGTTTELNRNFSHDI